MKFRVYDVDDPDIGPVYYQDKGKALDHAREANTHIVMMEIDDKKFPSAIDLWVKLLNRENFASWTKDISKEV